MSDLSPLVEERGCLGCLMDGYDHSCGFVDDPPMKTRSRS